MDNRNKKNNQNPTENQTEQPITNAEPAATSVLPTEQPVAENKPVVRQTKAEKEAEAKKAFREALAKLKADRDKELEEAKKLSGNRGGRGDKTNSSYAIRHQFFTNMKQTPKEVHEVVKVKFPDVKLAFVSTLMSDARAVYTVLEDMKEEANAPATEGQEQAAEETVNA